MRILCKQNIQHHPLRSELYIPQSLQKTRKGPTQWKQTSWPFNHVLKETTSESCIQNPCKKRRTDDDHISAALASQPKHATAMSPSIIRSRRQRSGKKNRAPRKKAIRVTCRLAKVINTMNANWPRFVTTSKNQGGGQDLQQC